VYSNIIVCFGTKQVLVPVIGNVLVAEITKTYRVTAFKKFLRAASGDRNPGADTVLDLVRARAGHFFSFSCVEHLRALRPSDAQMRGTYDLLDRFVVRGSRI
jgi:hypothetical protein